MNRQDGDEILQAACFRLGLFGARITQTFSERVSRAGLTHKQVGLLAVVATGHAHSQRDIAAKLAVAPSLVVTLVDQLLEMDAVKRERSASDRRVQHISLTTRGHELLHESAEIAGELDRELRSALTPAGRKALDTLQIDLERGYPSLAAGRSETS